MTYLFLVYLSKISWYFFLKKNTYLNIRESSSSQKGPFAKYQAPTSSHFGKEEWIELLEPKD
jgi:hypothetical protein